jgi:integrase/recombinase XerD
MKAATYKLIFNRKNKALEKDEKALVQIEIYYNRKRKYFSTGIYIQEHQWKDGIVIKHPNSRELNYSLIDKIKNLRDFEYSKTNNKKVFDLDMLKAFEDNGGEDYTFCNFIEDEIKISGFKEGTKKNQEALLHILEEYKKITKFSDLTYNNIEAFDIWLRDTRTETTIYGYHKRIKKYINKAILKDYISIQDNPYIKFSPKTGRYSDRKFLDLVELEKLENKKELHPRIELVKDIFLFQCYTGLSYSDIEKLTYKLISEDENGCLWIKTNREKTEEKSVIMLLPQAVKLLKKYSGKDKCFPVATNQKYNSYLKELAIICNIDKELTTHMARHTFATTITLMNGVSIETVSRMLGHTSIKTTQIYAKITEKRIKDEMTELTSKFQK